MTLQDYRYIIKSYRLENGFSQNKMAKLLKVYQETYRRWENTGNTLRKTEQKIINNFNKLI